ncbi:hypothetical protein [Oerskovia merdavium]|uniref:Uncharacterized protein n=1 Tax=Oerskovia merdavium TaxID=2762227 RepID=A0ABR8TWQ3_9CELL|nr:hypothetical protein [Oerskovia merdavium]MBD7980216.1 hypothetical protein [Oerskovia merdavium]
MIISDADRSDRFLLQLDEFCGRFVAAASHSDLQALDSVRPMPHGMCTWASFAGGELLTEHGFGTWTIWNATHADGHPAHDWLVQNELFVDLTAHQFDGYTSHIIGAGENPLAKRFPRYQLSLRTSKIVDRPPIVAFKGAIGALLETAVQ